MYWKLPLWVAALAALGGCGQEATRTEVTPPQASLPDDTVLRPDAAAARGPAAAAPGAAAPEVAQAPTAAASAPEATPVTPRAEAPLSEPPAPPTTAMGAQPPAPSSAAAAAAPPPGTAAPTEMSGAPQPAGAASSPAGRQSSADLPRVANIGDPEGARLLAQRPLLMPVAGVAPASLDDQYELRRGNGPHEAIDIVAPTGTPVVAVDDGRIAKLFTSRAGGYTVYQFDREQRLAYYYAHLDRYASGLREGMQVRRGELIGYVGSSGNANPATPHLHFAVFKLGTPVRWWQGKPVNPYPALSRAEPAELVAGR